MEVEKAMLEEKPLTVDLTKENASLQILPCTPLVSSHKVGWNGIYLKHYSRLPPYEMPEYYPAQHVIVTHNDQRPFGVERILDGRFQRESMVNGDIVVVPANVSHAAHWNTEIAITVLVLEPVLVAHIAYESINPDHVELVPHFSKSDPLINQIGLALKTELETDGLGSRFYAESAATMLAVHLLRRYSGRTHNIRDYAGGLPKYRLWRSTTARRYCSLCPVHSRTTIPCANSSDVGCASQSTSVTNLVTELEEQLTFESVGIGT